MEDGRLSRTRVEESVWRILWTKAKLGLISPFERDLFPVAFEVVGSEEHQAVIRRIMGSEERSE
jgi:hypothetical protein